MTVTGDARVPMAQVQAMFAGKATPDDVLAAAHGGNPRPAELRSPRANIACACSVVYRFCLSR